MVQSRFASWAAKRILGWLDAAVCRNAEHIVVISPGMKRALVDRGVPGSKISIMFNWVDEEVIYPREHAGALRRTLGIPDADLVFMFGGNHGEAQGLNAWLKAISAVKDLKNLHFLFVGDGTQKEILVDSATNLNLKRVYFLDRVDVDEYAQFAAEVDALIISLQDSSLFQITIPGKTQASLALQCAVIASVSGDAASVLVESGAALVAQPGDAVSIELMIREADREGRVALRERGRKGRHYYLEHMSLSRGSAALASILAKAARPICGV
jgi:glycosyltransferase involved in cell wall biosynthesis